MVYENDQHIKNDLHFVECDCYGELKRLHRRIARKYAKNVNVAAYHQYMILRRYVYLGD